MTSSHQSSGSQPQPAAPGGPYLLAAFFCEKILREQDGVVSFIRQIDRLIVNASGPQAPTQMPMTNFSANFVVLLKSGEARGRHDIRVVREGPSGIRDAEDLVSTTVFLEGEERGAGILANINMSFDQEGLYWFDVYADETLMTRMPFRVIYQRTTAQKN